MPPRPPPPLLLLLLLMLPSRWALETVDADDADAVPSGAEDVLDCGRLADAVVVFNVVDIAAVLVLLLVLC